MSVKRDLFDLRASYSKASLSKATVRADPGEQFSKWLDEALNSEISEPNAMVLSTVNASGIPSSRVVLLKQLTKEGFVFFTNYNSHKARDIYQNPNCALLFFWPELERQVRIEGVAEKISARASDTYFLSRPPESRLAAWASPQSETLESRKVLENKLAKRKKQIQQKITSRPPFWGGYLLSPHLFEFWQGRPGRLHDRIEYRKQQNQWEIVRLAP
ncbi:MAG: pyridoxamine 5'-phosphate oxidase [Bacteroidales bacterium]